MRLQVTRPASELPTASVSPSALCARDQAGHGIVAPARTPALHALVAAAALGLAGVASAQTIATDVFSNVLAMSVMPSQKSSLQGAWNVANWPDTAPAPTTSAGPILDRDNEAFAQLLGRRTQLSGRTLIPVAREAAYASAQRATSAEVFYDSSSALFETPKATDFDARDSGEFQHSPAAPAWTYSRQSLGNVVASFAALQRDSLNSGANSEASYATLTWSPSATSAKTSTGLVAFVYAADGEKSGTYSGPVAWTERTASGLGSVSGAELQEPAMPDFDTYLAIGAALAFLGLIVRRRQPELTA